MKILIINSRYFLSAGPEKYMFNITKILESHGHTVIPFSTKNPKNSPSDYEKYFVKPIGGSDKVYFEEYRKTPKTIYQMIERQFYSFEVKKKLKKLINDTSPDIAYILHHQNKLSPSIIDACKSFNLPVVMRISDLGLACPSGVMLRNSNICEKCVTNSLFSSVKYKCVKNSFFASLIKASGLAFQRMINIYNKIDVVVFPSKHTLEKLSFLFAKPELIHLPTFVLPSKIKKMSVGAYFMCVGRVEEEKGFLYAIQAVKDTNIELKIVGESHTGYGDFLTSYVQKHKITNVQFLGGKSAKELHALYARSRAVIIPTACYENMPNVALEGMAHGKALLTFNLGSMKSIVKNDYNGFIVPPKNVARLKEKIILLSKNDSLCLALGENSLKEIKTVYDAQNHYVSLISIFKKLIAKRSKNEN